MKGRNEPADKIEGCSLMVVERVGPEGGGVTIQNAEAPVEFQHCK